MSTSAFMWVPIITLVGGYVLGRLRRGASENRGEAAVRRQLTRSFGTEDYHLLNNLTLPYQDGTTQIDHVLVSRYGIFVIESKHYSGWIFGDSRSRTWTQVLYQHKSKFQNPLHQNAKHVRAIRKLLDFLSPESIHSFVVFTGNGNFKTQRPDGIVSLTELVDCISSFKGEAMSQNRMQFCVGRLECNRRLLTRKTDVEHQAYLDRRFGEVD